MNTNIPIKMSKMLHFYTRNVKIKLLSEFSIEISFEATELSDKNSFMLYYFLSAKMSLFNKK